MKRIVFTTLLLVFTMPLYAYQLSDLNGRWYNSRFGAYFTLSGLPLKKVPYGQMQVASYRAQINGMSLVGFCEVTQKEVNFFESFCYSTADDHTYIRFIDKNTMEEDDLVYGLGKLTSSRVR